MNKITREFYEADCTGALWEPGQKAHGHACIASMELAGKGGRDAAAIAYFMGREPWGDFSSVSNVAIDHVRIETWTTGDTKSITRHRSETRRRLALPGVAR